MNIPLSIAGSVSVSLSLITSRKKSAPQILQEMIELKALEKLPPAYLEEIDKKLNLKPGTTETTIKALLRIGKNPKVIEEILSQVSKLEEIEQRTEEVLKEVGKVVNSLNIMRKEIYEVKKLLLHYNFIEDSQELKRIIEEYSRVKLPEDRYLLPTNTPELRETILEILEKARESPVIIVAPPGTGKTVLLYQIGKALIERGQKVGYLRPGQPLTDYHLKEDRTILYDNVTEREVLLKLTREPDKAKQTIVTIRDYMYKILIDELAKERRGIKEELKEYVYLLNLDRGLVEKITKKILEEKEIKVEKEEIIDKLIEKIKVKYDLYGEKYETYTLLSVSLLPKILEGKELRELDLEKIPNTLLGFLSKIIVNTLTEDFTQQITIMKILAYIGGAAEPHILNDIEEKVYELFPSSNREREYRALLTEINSRIIYPHDSWIILLSPTLKRLRERGYPTEETEELHNKIKESIEEMITRLYEKEIRERIEKTIKTKELLEVLEVKGFEDNPHGQNLIFKMLANLIIAEIIEKYPVDLLEDLIQQIEREKLEQMDTILHYIYEKRYNKLEDKPFTALHLALKYNSKDALNALVRACASGVGGAASAIRWILREKPELLEEHELLRDALNALVRACASGVREAASAIEDIAWEKPELFRMCSLSSVRLGCLDGVNKLCEILSALNVSGNVN